VQNLLSNANKYTPEGGDISVSVTQEGSDVVLKVEDSGPGIPVALYERVFERFYRLNGDQHNTDILGCGLGLTIVQDIASLHGAKIQLGHSEFEQGLKVSVVFPQKVKN